MTLSDLAALGSFVSGIAVLASLGFLYFQMRQMTEQVRQSERNQRSLLMQQRTAAGIEAMFHVTEPHVASMLHDVRRNPRGVSALQLEQFFSAQWSNFLWLEDAHYHYTAGLFDKASFEPTIIAIKGLLSQPHMRAFWYAARSQYSPRFVDFVDGQLPGIPVSPATGDEMLAGWNAALDQVEREMKAGAGGTA